MRLERSSHGEYGCQDAFSFGRNRKGLSSSPILNDLWKRMNAMEHKHFPLSEHGVLEMRGRRLGLRGVLREGSSDGSSSACTKRSKYCTSLKGRKEAGHGKHKPRSSWWDSWCHGGVNMQSGQFIVASPFTCLNVSLCYSSPTF